MRALEVARRRATGLGPTDRGPAALCALRSSRPASSSRDRAVRTRSVLREVTRMVGVVPNAAYRHFADRDALLAAVRAQAVAELARRMANGMSRVRAGAHAPTGARPPADGSRQGIHSTSPAQSQASSTPHSRTPNTRARAEAISHNHWSTSRRHSTTSSRLDSWTRPADQTSNTRRGRRSTDSQSFSVGR